MNFVHSQVMPSRQQMERLETPSSGDSEEAEELEKTVHKLQRELQLSRAREEKAEVGPHPSLNQDSYKAGCLSTP